MKESRLLIALLVMLVAASGYAQDSYREAVKEYMTTFDQFEKSKLGVSKMSVLFERGGQVDIDQLTNRYFDEQYEDDLIDYHMSALKMSGMTEADLKEVAALLTTPEGKNLTIHREQWSKKLISNWMETDIVKRFMGAFESLGQNEYQPFLTDKERDLSEEELMDHLLGPAIQPNADIDAAYAAKFKEVMLESDLANGLMGFVMKRFIEAPTTYSSPEDRNKMKDWLTASLSNIMLNSAYGTLTLEDLDYVSKLNSNEAYRKLNGFSKLDEIVNAPEFENLKASAVTAKYMDWMQEQGAKITEDPKALLEIMKSLYDLSNLNFDD